MVSSNVHLQLVFLFSGRLLSNESLFFYRPGQNYFNFYHPNHVPHFSDELNISSLSPEVRRACGQNRECLFDAAETGSVSFGEQTSNDENSFDDDQKNVGKQ